MNFKLMLYPKYKLEKVPILLWTNHISLLFLGFILMPIFTSSFASSTLTYDYVPTPEFTEKPKDLNVTTFAGHTARLPCTVRNLGGTRVSWIRGRDLQVLSTGRTTVATDMRISVLPGSGSPKRHKRQLELDKNGQLTKDLQSSQSHKGAVKKKSSLKISKEYYANGSESVINNRKDQNIHPSSKLLQMANYHSRRKRKPAMTFPNLNHIQKGKTYFYNTEIPKDNNNKYYYDADVSNRTLPTSDPKFYDYVTSSYDHLFHTEDKNENGFNIYKQLIGSSDYLNSNEYFASRLESKNLKGFYSDKPSSHAFYPVYEEIDEKSGPKLPKAEIKMKESKHTIRSTKQRSISIFPPSASSVSGSAKEISGSMLPSNYLDGVWEPEDFALQIKFADRSDAGLYICQINTDPRMSQVINFSVIDMVAEIVGPSELFVKAGNPVSLECKVNHATVLPGFIFWYKEDTLVDYVGSRDRIVVLTGADGSSKLQMNNVVANDSGNYTCWPSGGASASVHLNIIVDERPAAMQQGNAGSTVQPENLILILLLILIYLSTMQENVIYEKTFHEVLAKLNSLYDKCLQYKKAKFEKPLISTSEKYTSLEKNSFNKNLENYNKCSANYYQLRVPEETDISDETEVCQEKPNGQVETQSGTLYFSIYRNIIDKFECNLGNNQIPFDINYVISHIMSSVMFCVLFKCVFFRQIKLSCKYDCKYNQCTKWNSFDISICKRSYV